MERVQGCESPWPLLLTVVLAFSAWNKLVEGSIQDGGAVAVNTVIHEYETPMLVKNDVIVQEGVTLTLEAGVKLQFAPGVTLGVNGTLVARVQDLILQYLNV